MKYRIISNGTVFKPQESRFGIFWNDITFILKGTVIVGSTLYTVEDAITAIENRIKEQNEYAHRTKAKSVWKVVANCWKSV
jgi:hypothetical protein